ncbi:hypothetical protein RintRC_0723 [Richelia intracellularis]|nr:hypothetical protein RintRC_0723 [Richelia intracellularis]
MYSELSTNLQLFFEIISKETMGEKVATGDLYPLNSPAMRVKDTRSWLQVGKLSAT